jgi:5-methylcytosine-specific restriction protein B
MLVETKSEFSSLFQEFLKSYAYTASGLSHIAAYDEQRQQGQRNFEMITASVQSGSFVAKDILMQLLPYEDTPSNRQNGVWIHISLDVTKVITLCFEGGKWTQPHESQLVAEAVFKFITCCNDSPGKLSVACSNFSQLPYFKDFQMGMLTPIINALRPDDFLLISNKSIQTINYFAKTAYTQQLTDYPLLNFRGNNLIRQVSDIMHQSGVPALRDNDLFDMFSYWLCAVKKFDFIDATSILNAEPINIISHVNKIPQKSEYTLDKLSEKTGYNQLELQRWIHAIKRKKQAILYGSPGTGKTFIAEQIAKYLINGEYGFSELIQLHPAYSYEDFIQGIRPQSQDGRLTYPLVPGRFLEFCQKSESYQGNCVLIIDEINRANLAQVFGELMYLLEYRNREIQLAGGNTFSIPENVCIIGTMNTADRSISQIDHALRRRFAFIGLRSNYDVLRQYHLKTGFAVDGLITILQQLNQAIADKNYEIGISFFLTENLRGDIKDIWLMEIEPYLEEYFFNQLDKVDEFRWEKIEKFIWNS